MKVRKITPRKWVFSEDRNITPLKYVKISQTHSMGLQWHHLFILLDLIYLHFPILREKWATVDKNPLKCLGTPSPVNYPKYDPWMTPMPEQDCWIHTASARVDIYAQRSHSQCHNPNMRRCNIHFNLMTCWQQTNVDETESRQGWRTPSSP